MATRTRRKRAQVTRPPQIRKVSADPKVTMMLFGHPGFGKTSFIATGPDETLILRPPTETMDPVRRINPNIDEWVIKGWTDMWEALEYLRDNEGAGYQWVWLDSISLMQDTGLDDIWADVLVRNPRRKEYGLDKLEYGTNMFRLSQWVRSMVGAAYFNMGITAHPALLPNPDKDDPEDDSTPDDILMPWVQGKQMSTKICGYCNLVAYLRIVGRDRKRVIYTEPNAIFYAKNQLAPIPKGRLVSPTIPRLMKYVTAGSAATEE